MEIVKVQLLLLYLTPLLIDIIGRVIWTLFLFYVIYITDASSLFQYEYQLLHTK
jgi:hypothetical protein